MTEPINLEAIRERYLETKELINDTNAYILVTRLSRCCQDVPPLVNEVARLTRELDIAKATARTRKTDGEN